eukprot:1159982-Pelagomonas_calceolata.AAC.1
MLQRSPFYISRNLLAQGALWEIHSCYAGDQMACPPCDPGGLILLWVSVVMLLVEKKAEGSKGAEGAHDDT